VPLRPFSTMPANVREWAKYLTEVPVVPDEESTGEDQLQDDSVTNAKLRNSAGNSVIGRTSGTAGDPADIVASNNGEYLRRSGGVLGFGGIADTDLPSTIARDTEVTAAVSAEATARDAAITAAIATHTASANNVTDADLAGAITAHEAAGDPHPGYLTAAEGNAAYQPLAAVLSMLHTGTGSPETVLTATVGHIYLRSDGGANTTLYVKESGSSNTGWVAK
jgi:hypothetical protein